MDSTPFASPALFRKTFERKLDALLTDDDALGVYILVLANAAYDPVIWAHLSRRLAEKFDSLSQSMREHEAQGLLLGAAEDDLAVFRRLTEVGFEHLQTTCFRKLGPWELQFNQLRSFRPPRMTHAVAEGVFAPFNPDGFHFNKPFLRKETFWHGELRGRTCTLLYNKFPFVELHGLLVPEPQAQRPQFLSRQDNEYLWSLSEMLGESLPGVGFGYNSYGAGASVNHLHFQMFLRERALPVADPCWQHNGGQQSYPAHCYRFDHAGAAWQLIEQLHRRELSYNLIYLPGVIYCLPRRKQGSFGAVPWSGGFAWYEMAGGFTTFDEDAFTHLQQEQLSGALAQISLAF